MIRDLGLAQQLCLLFDLLEQKDNFLLKETMYLTTLACLMKRHGKSNHTFVSYQKHIQKY